MKDNNVVNVSAAARTGTSLTVKLAADRHNTRSQRASPERMERDGRESPSRFNFSQRLTPLSPNEISFRAVNAPQHPVALTRKIAFLAFIIFAFASSPRAATLYPGITPEQSRKSHAALKAFYNGNLTESLHILGVLDTIEGDSLPPLSRLLQVAVCVMQVQRNDAAGPKEEKRLRKMAAEAADDGLQSCRDLGETPTCLLIEGGIQGFMATLKISSNPPKALTDGLHALKLLEKGLEADSSVADAWMGLGIFHCTAANAPLVARATLKVMGRSADMLEGLHHLRRAAYRGQYTSVASQFFLIQFLSPYEDELRREKRQIFRSLIKAFPESPYYPFLREEEALSFYPDSFYVPREKRRLERQIRAADPVDFAGRRYLNLIKHQYTLLEPHPSPAYTPDTSFDLREYAFYPVFIEALRIRRHISLDTSEASKKNIRNLKTLRDSALSLLRDSDMSTSNIHLYEWHIRDALRTKMWKRRADNEDSLKEDSTEE
jgi:hypothetical protein